MGTIIKWFIPSSAKLAAIAAEKIKATVNESGKTDTIAKYSQLLGDITEKIAEVNKMLENGVISEDEAKCLTEMLTPLFDRIMKLI